MLYISLHETWVLTSNKGFQMTEKSTQSGWIKWTVGAVITLMGAGGGLVAVLQYLDDRRATAWREYQEAFAEWEAYSPESIAGGPQEVGTEKDNHFLAA